MVAGVRFMSFSAEVKNELCGIRQNKCCDMAECYGMLALSRSFSKENISLLTEHEETALRFGRLLRECFGVDTKISFGGIKVQNMAKNRETAFLKPSKKRIF